MPWFWFLLAGAVGGLIVLWLRRSARAGYEEGEAYAKQVCDYSADERGARATVAPTSQETHTRHWYVAPLPPWSALQRAANRSLQKRRSENV